MEAARTRRIQFSAEWRNETQLASDQGAAIEHRCQNGVAGPML